MSKREPYYFGAWGAAGHFLWTPSGRPTALGRCGLPWGDIDGRLAVDPAFENPHRRGTWAPQPEGRARLHRLDGWTALAFWDRSGDERPGSNSALLARSELSAPEMLALFELHFPAVWSRITARFQVSLPSSNVLGSGT